MLTKNYLKSLLLLLCMIVGAGTAWAEEYKLTISSSDFNTTSYAANNNEKKTNAVCTSDANKTFEVSWTSYQVMKNGDNMQWQKSKGYIYNSTDLGTIKSVKVTSTAGTFTTYYGTSQQPSSGTTVGNGFFQTKVGSATGTSSKIEVVFDIEDAAPASPLSSIALSGTYPTNFYVGDAFSHEGMTVTATYEDKSNKDVTEKADFSDYDMSNASSQTVTVSYTENDITKTAKYGITVSERPKFTVTFSDGGSVMEESAGAGVTLPSRAAIGDYTFAGWSETNVAVETTVAPTIIPAGSYNPTANITLYPVYTRTEGGGESEDKSVSVTISEYASAHNWSSGNQYTTIIMDENITVTGDDTGNNSKFYNSSNPHNWRFYATNNGKFTVSTTVGELKNVSVTYTGNTLTYNGNNVTSNTSVAVSGTSATFSVSGSSSNSQVSKIDVDYTIAGTGVIYYFSAPVAAAVERPVITFAENPFLFSTKATITCTTDGAKIYYSYDKETWNEYTDALNITATTTIYAKATKGDDESTVASMTATKNLAESTVAISGDLTVDLKGETNVEAGTLTAAVTYNEAAVDGATVTWSGNNDAVATINATTGAVTIKSRGTVTFTATYAGNNDYKKATATKEITVIDSKAPGTQGRPYTVAEAIEATPASGTSEMVYIHGFVSQFYGDDIVSDGTNYRYYISDDGTTTTQLLVYKGKGLNQETFANASDLEIGDEVVIYGGLTTYKSEAEVASGNYLISRTEKPASDLTKTGDITLDFKNDNTVATLTDYFTTSSTGAITYTVADETVIENADELISALKVGTTTVTVSQAATLSYKAGEITINVTVQDTREAATTIPAINIETLKVNDEGTLSVTNPVKADDGVTFSFASSDDNVLSVDNGEYAALAVGTVIVTVTATPSNTNLYKPVVANFEVTVEADVKTDTEIAIDASGSTVYGTPKNVDFVITDGYNGELSYIIDNDAIADVEIGASTITFTPKAVGTAVITISAPATATFNAAEDVQYTLEVTAPEGGETAMNLEETYTFDFSNNTGWAFPTDYQTGENTYTKDGKTVTLNAASSGYKHLGSALLIGKSGATLTLPAFDKPVTKITTTGVIGASGKVTQNIYVGETAVSTETTSATVDHEYVINSEYQAPGTIYTFMVTNGNNTQLTDITVYMKATATAKLNASGYATFCSQYPLDFSAAEGYTAWQIKEISGETITFEKIKGAIKGGQGILLKGEADATVTLASEDASIMLDGNLLYGTTAPTYVADDEYFGLSGNKFVKINAGTVPAGKALLPASAIPAGARELTFVFEDGQTTGIESLNPALSKGGDTIYDLQGRKVAQPTKGLYIKNGKKVVMK